MRGAAAAVVGLALILGGCGVAVRTVTRTAAPAADRSLSLAAYRAAAARLCRAYREQVAALDRPRTKQQLIHDVARLRAVTLSRVARLHALRPPPRIAAEVRRLAAYRPALVGAFGRFRRALARGQDPRAAIAAFRVAVRRLAAPIDAGWRALGITACET